MSFCFSLSHLFVPFGLDVAVYDNYFTFQLLNLVDINHNDDW